MRLLSVVDVYVMSFIPPLHWFLLWLLHHSQSVQMNSDDDDENNDKNNDENNDDDGDDDQSNCVCG